MLNRVVLVGRLARDPFELRRNANTGNAAISFTLVVDNRFSKQQEEQKPNYISCVAFNKQAEFVEQYIKKGMLIGLEGRIQTRDYDDKNGNHVYVTEVAADNIQILESKSARENREQAEPYQPHVSEPVKQQPTSGIDIDEDELPF